MSTSYKDFAIELAKRAGDIIRDNFAIGMKKDWKDDHTPLTNADLIINEHVRESVQRVFPKFALLSEEGGISIVENEFVWVCDPLDGTIPYSHGIPACVFSLALTHNGEVVLGVIYDPFLDRLFTAEKGKGAFLNNRRILVSNVRTLENVVIGISTWKGALYDLQPLIAALKDRYVKTIDVCSILYLGALVASGELSATVFPGDKAYDSAALKILIEEAGGRVTDIFGLEQKYDRNVNGHLATNGFLHSELSNLISRTVRKR